MNGPRALRWILLLTACVVAGPAWSMGLLVPSGPGSSPLAIESHRVNINVRDSVAITHVDQVFRNSSGVELEAVFIFPVPENATVHDFALWMNGVRVQGEILESTQARQVYESIVRQVRDPGLVEYIDGRLFQASIFPVPANGTQRVELEFSQVLELQGELHRLVYPLRTGRTSATTLTDFTLTADIQASMPIRAVYSPTHAIDVNRESETHTVIGLEQANADLERDFVLYLSASDEEVGLTLFTFDQDGPGGEDGFFLMLISPRLEREGEIPAQDVTFVVDASGSMDGEKMEQARQTLRYCIGQLRPEDRFNIVRFSTTTRTLFDDLTAASADNVTRAATFIDRMEAAGGTAIEAALDRALAQSSDPARPHYIIFITDGLPTVGETSAEALIAQVQARNTNTRIFTFGVGYDVDTQLLDRVAAMNGGLSDYVRPTEDIQVAVSNLYDRISHPVLTGLTLDFGDAEVDDFYPSAIPDLFAGHQIVVAGRFGNAIESEIMLRGTANGVARTYRFRETFAASGEGANEHNDFIPQIWATRKIGFLIDQIRLNGENPELAESVRTLGLRFGLVTPYTSYLAVDDSEFNRPPVDENWRFEGDMVPPMNEPAPVFRTRSGWGGNEEGESMTALPSAAPTGGLDFGGASGERAVESSRESRRLQQIATTDGAAPVQQIGGRVLQRESDGVWRERGVREHSGARRVQIRYLSDAYFDLLAETGHEVRRLLAQGESVELVWADDLILEIAATGAERMDADMRMELGL
jgi:Ca-activated chloride channel homolog